MIHAGLSLACPRKRYTSGLLSGYMGWYVGRRPRRFREGGRARYETLAEHRRRLGYPVPPFAAQQAQ